MAKNNKTTGATVKAAETNGKVATKTPADDTPEIEIEVSITRVVTAAGAIRWRVQVDADGEPHTVQTVRSLSDAESVIDTAIDNATAGDDE